MLLVVLLVTGLRLWVAAAAGLGDAEAYYWTWSRELAPGYFDHGPTVALLIRLGTAVLGQSPLGVRAPFVVLSGLLLWCMAALSRRFGAPRHGLWAVIALLAMPAFQVAGAAANPDVPFMALVGLFLWWTTSQVEPSPQRAGLAGLAVGLATSTKLLGLLLLAPLLQLAWRSPVRRRRLALLALGLGGVALGAFPVLLWNLRHGWPTLAYHLVYRHTAPVGPSWLNLAKLVGGQLGYISPLVLVGLGAAAAVLWRRRDRWPESLLLCTAASLLGAGYVLILLIPGAEPHWPAAGYLALVPTLAARLPVWLAERRRLARTLTVLALLFSGLVALALHLHVLTDLGVGLARRLGGYEPRYDLSNELRGWDVVADRVARELGRSSADALVAGCHYTSCSQLAFAARGRFAVRCPSPRLDQFDFSSTGDGSGLRGVDLLYVRDPRFPYEAGQLYRCRRVEPVRPAVEIRRAGGVVRRFQLQWCRGFHGLAATRWPPRRQAPTQPL